MQTPELPGPVMTASQHKLLAMWGNNFKTKIKLGG